jgi:hypothetical protein
MTAVSTAGEWRQTRRLTALEETVTLTVFLAPLSTPVLPRRLSKSRQTVHNPEAFAHNLSSPARLRIQEGRSIKNTGIINYSILRYSFNFQT